MKTDTGVVKTKGLDRLFHHHLVAGDGEARFGHGIGNVARCDGTEQLAHFRGGTDHAHRQLVHLAGFGLGFAAAAEIVRLALCLFGFKTLKIGLVGAKGLALRQQEVAGIARLYLHHIAHLAELLDTFEQNDFHCFCLLASRAVTRSRKASAQESVRA